jgi:peptide deformylase
MGLKIVHYNDRILRKKGEKIIVFGAALKKLADQMIAAMHDAEGIGLAAQQVGQAIQMCVLDLRNVESEFDWEYDGARTPLELFMPLVLVNPEVATVAQPETVYEEGCLSFPKIRADVVRPDECTVKFQDPAGHPHVLKCNGLLSRCVQHEADHLNGVLFIDRMAKDVKSALEPQLKELKARTKERANA